MGTATYVFDSSRLFCEGARLILRSAAFDVMGTGETVAELCDIPQARDELLLVIGHLANVPVRDLVRLILATHPQARVVLLADVYNHQEAVAAMECGAKGYLHKNLSADNFIKALQLVAEECSVISGWPAAVTRAAPIPPQAKPVGRDAEDEDEDDGAADDAPDDALVHALPADDGGEREMAADWEAGAAIRNLSPRETAILRQLTSGHSNKQIARDLAIAEATVKVHVKTILRKIRVRNRTQAAIWAMAEPSVMGSA